MLVMVLTLFIKVKLTESNHNSLSASINSTNASRLSNNSFKTLLLWNKYNTYTLLKDSYDCSVQFIEYLHGFHDQLGWDTTNLENRTMTLGTVNLKHIAYNKKKNYMIAFEKCVYTKLIIVKYKNNIILTSNTNDILSTRTSYPIQFDVFFVALNTHKESVHLYLCTTIINCTLKNNLRLNLHSLFGGLEGLKSNSDMGIIKYHTIKDALLDINTSDHAELLCLIDINMLFLLLAKSQCIFTELLSALDMTHFMTRIILNILLLCNMYQIIRSVNDYKCNNNINEVNDNGIPSNGYKQVVYEGIHKEFGVDNIYNDTVNLLMIILVIFVLADALKSCHEYSTTSNPSMNPTTNVPTTAVPTNVPTTASPTTYTPTRNPITRRPSNAPTDYPLSNYPTTNSPTTYIPTTHPIAAVTTKSTIDIILNKNAVIFIKQTPKDDTIISNPFDRFVIMNKFYVKSKYNIDADCFKCFQWTFNNTLINDLYGDNSEYVTFYNIKIDTVILANGNEYDIFESYLIIHSINYGHTNNNNELYCSQHSDNSEIIKTHLLQYGNDYNIRLEVCYNGVKNIGSNTLKIVTNQLPFGGYCQIDNLDSLQILSTFNIECFNWTSQSNAHMTYNAILSNGVLMANEFVPISQPISGIVSIGDLEIKILIKDSFESITCYNLNVSFPSFTQIVEETGNMTQSINILVDTMSNIMVDTNLGENNNIASALYSVIDSIVTSDSNTISFAPFQQLTEDIVENIFESSLLNKNNLTADAISSELSVIMDITSNPQLVNNQMVVLFIDEYIPLMFEGFNTYIDNNSGRRRRRRRLLTSDDEDMASIANELEILVNKLQVLLMNVEVAVSGDDIIDTNMQNDMLIEYALNGIHIALSDSYPGEEYYNIISNIASNMSKIVNGIKFDNTNTEINKTLTCGLVTENIIIPTTFTSENRGLFDCSFIKSTVNNFIPSDTMTITNSSYIPVSNVIAINLYSDSDLVPMESETDACDPYLINIVTTDTSLLQSFSNFNFELDEKVTFPTCNFWDNSSSTWSDYGCWLYNVSVEHNIVTCSCVHLSTFQVSADDFIPKANVLSAWHFRNFTASNLLKYPTVWITMLSVFMIIFCLCIVSTLNEKDNTAILAFEDIIFRKVRNEKLRTSEIGREIECMAKYLPNADTLGSGIFQLAKGKNAKKSMCRLTLGLYRIHLFNNHTLLSIFVKAEGTNFSSKQRLGCFLMYLCTVGVASALVYGVDQNNIIGDISASFWISIFGTLPVMITKQIFLNSKPKMVPRTMYLENKDKEGQTDATKFQLKKYQTAFHLAREAKLQRTLSTKVKMVNSVRLTLFDQIYPLHQNWKICAWLFLIVWTVGVSFAALQFGLEFDIKYQKLRNTNNEQLNLFDNECWQNNQKLLIEDTLSNLQLDNLQHKLDVANDFGDNYDILFSKIKSESARWVISCFQSILLSIFWWQPITIYLVTWIKIFAFSWNLQMTLGPKTIIGLVKRCCCCSHNTDEQGLKECLTPEKDKDKFDTNKYIQSTSTYSVFAHQNRPLDLIGYISNDQLFTDIGDEKEEEDIDDSFSLSLSITEEIKKNSIHTSLPPIQSNLEMIPTQSHDAMESLNMNEVKLMGNKAHVNIALKCIQEKDLNRIDSGMIDEVLDDVDFTPTIGTPVSFAQKVGKSPRKEARVTFAMTEKQLAEILDEDDIEFTKNRNPIVISPISTAQKKVGNAPRETFAMTDDQITQILDENINSKDLSPISIAQKVGNTPRETVAMTEHVLAEILNKDTDINNFSKNRTPTIVTPVSISNKAMTEHILAEILDKETDINTFSKNRTPTIVTPVSISNKATLRMTEDVLAEIFDVQDENFANKEPEISTRESINSAKHEAVFSDMSNLDEILDIAQMID